MTNRVLSRWPWHVISVIIALVPESLFAFDTIGNGFGSKWGDDPMSGSGAIVTWGYMLDGTTLDPMGFPFHDAIEGTSNISALRASVDVNYGSGAFDAAIQNAFATWSAVANITFVGPLVDLGQPVGANGAVAPHIRIGAFQAVPGEWFQSGSAIGLGPPGPSGPNDFPLSGDVIFNLTGIGTQRPYQIAPGEEDIDSVDVFNYGVDVEGLFLHELGHAAIGLNHPHWVGETPDRRVMYVGDFENPSAPYCCQAINRQLDSDDIAAAQYVYGIRGDYNHDRGVDAADFVLWRKTLETTVVAGTSADGNVDGQITSADYTVFREGFGYEAQDGHGEQPSFAIGSNVPEPTTGMLALVVMVALSASRARQRCRELTINPANICGTKKSALGGLGQPIEDALRDLRRIQIDHHVQVRAVFGVQAAIQDRGAVG